MLHDKNLSNDQNFDFACSVECQREYQDSEIMMLFRRHQAIMSAASKYVSEELGSAEDAEMDRLFFDEATEVEKSMMGLPAASATDMAAKMLVAHSYGDFSCIGDEAPVWAEARRLTS
ncbi:hypothetical protein [Thalassovita sp.]|uniref:hypothetical protein n=1 Tax=Thalassovita sp. TaxID=1979401 RepID=UPI002AB20C22|nr:hypothetical protein [Thalassovita sp.]